MPKKHGTASVSGLFVEFLKVLIGAIPRSVPDDIAEGWMANASALRRKLEDLLLPPENRQFSVDALEMAVVDAVGKLRTFLGRVNDDLRFTGFTFQAKQREPNAGVVEVHVRVIIDGWGLDPGYDHHVFLRFYRLLGMSEWQVIEAWFSNDHQGQHQNVCLKVSSLHDRVEVEHDTNNDIKRLRNLCSETT